VTAEDETAALEARIAADPDDDAAYAVYGDLLQGRGDPRGELIALMLAREAELARGVGRSPVATAITKRMHRHAAAWRGKLSVLPEHALVWRRGFFHRVMLRGADVATIGEILAHPSGRFVRELAVTCDEVDDAYRVIDAIAEHEPPLGELELIVHGPRGGHVDLLDLGALWPALARARRIAVVTKAFDLGAVRAERAERLRLHAMRLSGDNLRAIAAAPWPALQRLELRFAAAGEPSSAGLVDLLALVRRADLPALTHLKLRGCEHAGEALVALAEAPLARQLVVIDLAHGLVEAAELRALTRHRASFPALRELWLPAVAWPQAKQQLDGIATHVLSDARGALDTFDAEIRR